MKLRKPQPLRRPVTLCKPVFVVAVAALFLMAAGCRETKSDAGGEAKQSAALPIRIAAGGDVYLGGAFKTNPLAHASVFLAGDLRFVNYEGPITDEGREEGFGADGTPDGTPVRLRTEAKRGAWLRGHVDLVSLENNHKFDQAQAGVDATVATLHSNEVAFVDAAHPAQLRVKNQSIVVFARFYSGLDGLDGEDREADPILEKLVAHARTRASVLVSLHWGHTGEYLPTANQVALAHRLVDAGASAILGHGPHTVQGVERYRDALIAYSLGNLAFGCPCTDVTDAMVLTFTLAPDGRTSSATLTPLVAGLGAPPRASTDPDLAALITTISEAQGTEVTTIDGVLSIK